MKAQHYDATVAGFIDQCAAAEVMPQLPVSVCHCSAAAALIPSEQEHDHHRLQQRVYRITYLFKVRLALWMGVGECRQRGTCRIDPLDGRIR